MTVAEILSNIRERIYDTDVISYTDEELMSYLNDVIILLGYKLIGAGKTVLLTTATFATKTPNKPTDFDRFAGKYPIEDLGATFSIDWDVPMEVKYYKKPTLVKLTTDTMPYDDIYNNIIEQVVAMIALNRNEYDVTLDKEISTQLETAIL